MCKFFFLIIFVLLSGCAAQQQENNHLADLLNTQHPQAILQQLQENKPADRDRVQFQLNMGFLQFITGDFQGAISTLSAAKKEMEDLAATSVTENIGAGTINETLRSYSGYPTDKVMVHNILALSYLFANHVYDARVEMLQSELAMKALAEKDQVTGQLASANLLGAIIYELLDEQSNAFISYKDAADIIEKRGMALPLGLKQALLRVSFKLGAQTQYLAYQQQFSTLPAPQKGNQKQLFVLYFDGVVSHKIENSIVVPSLGANQLIRISMPTYPRLHKHFSSANIITNQSQQRSEVVDDVDTLVRDDLEKEYASILLLTTTRAVTKYQLVKKVQDQSPLLGLIMNIATIASEDADLRSWNMLPANIQFAYLEPQNNEVMIDSNNTSLQKIDITGGTKHVVLMSSLSNNIFHYQQ